MRSLHRSLSVLTQAGHKLTAGIGLALALSIGIGLSSVSAPAHAQAAAGKTELYWFGQAGFKIKTPGGKTIVIDPWLTGGPKTPAPYKTDISALGKVDLLLVSLNLHLKITLTPLSLSVVLTARTRFNSLFALLA